MRLVQLALKVGMPQHEIISFLQDKGIEIPNNGNLRLEDAHVALVIDHFIKAEQLSEPETLQDEVIDTEPAAAEESDTNLVYKDTDQPVEVIRAKKIKLEGIKVLGKIELPKPVKKPQNENASDEKVENKKATTPKHSEKRNGKNGKNRFAKKYNRRTETYEQKLKREERDEKKKKRALEKKIKLKKKRNYEKKVKQAQPELPKKKKRAKKAALPTPQQPKKIVRHKNPIRRLWAWLNGKYD